MHIGKAGGGSVRARFAAAAWQYHRGNDGWKDNHDKDAYYTVDVENENDDEDDKDASQQPQQQHRAYFCDSAMKNYRTHRAVRTFEGTRTCAASTPLGHAIACPSILQHVQDFCLACHVNDLHCHRVYTGHNYLGNELHWLPPRYLSRWWKSLVSKPRQGVSVVAPETGPSNNNKNEEQVSSSSSSLFSYHAQLLQAFDLIYENNTQWCPHLGMARLATEDEFEMYYENCSIPLGRTIDQLALQWRMAQTEMDTSTTNTITVTNATPDWPTRLAHLDPAHHQWGPLYASLPVLRTTLVRDPFAWLLSKFFWHSQNLHHSCANVTAATLWRNNNHHRNINILERGDHDPAPGWAHRTARTFILQLCGEDCQIRWEQVTTALGANFTSRQEELLLQSFTRQADYNLRHSFVVVGVSDDIGSFYDMVSRRVQYLDLSRNLHVQGERHRSGASRKCKALYYGDDDNKPYHTNHNKPSLSDFRRQMIRASPAIAALWRLYQTALRVNAFQKQELESCESVGKKHG